MSPSDAETAVLITGPTRGLGYELHRRFARHPCKLIMIGRDLARIRGIVPDPACDMREIECDFSELQQGGNRADLQARVSDALTWANTSKVLFINNAGVVGPIGRLGSVSEDEIARSMYVNFHGPTIILGACIRHASSHGAALHVLNISSGAAIRPLPGWGAYCASKAAIRHFFDVAEAEQTIDLSVRHFDPGVLDTRMQEQIRSSSSDDFPLVEKFVSLKMSGSLKSPMDVAIEIEESLLEWMSLSASAE